MGYVYRVEICAQEMALPDAKGGFREKDIRLGSGRYTEICVEGVRELISKHIKIDQVLKVV